MSQYLVLIYGDGERFQSAGPEVGELTYKEHEKFGSNNHESIVGGNALQDVSTATSIRTDEEGKVTVTDGPFIETKETLGGYYLIEAPDFDAALAIAKQVPARFGGVEVRPIMVFD